MLTVRIEQLTVQGLSPCQIRSLVGCSPHPQPTCRDRTVPAAVITAAHTTAAFQRQYRFGGCVRGRRLPSNSHDVCATVSENLSGIARRHSHCMLERNVCRTVVPSVHGALRRRVKVILPPRERGGFCCLALAEAPGSPMTRVVGLWRVGRAVPPARVLGPSALLERRARRRTTRGDVSTVQSALKWAWIIRFIFMQ